MGCLRARRRPRRSQRCAARTPHAGSASAIRTAGSSAGWQHAKISASSSSPPAGLRFGDLPGGIGLPGSPERVAAQHVDGLVPGRRDQPPARARRDAVARPLGDGRRARFLHCVLGDLQVTAAPRERSRDGRPPVLTHDGVELLGAFAVDAVPSPQGAATPITGRIWIDPSDAVGSVFAQCRASSRSAHSTSVKPPKCSLI